MYHIGRETMSTPPNPLPIPAGIKLKKITSYHPMSGIKARTSGLNRPAAKYPILAGQCWVPKATKAAVPKATATKKRKSEEFDDGLDDSFDKPAKKPAKKIVKKIISDDEDDLVNESVEEIVAPRKPVARARKAISYKVVVSSEDEDHQSEEDSYVEV